MSVKLYFYILSMLCYTIPKILQLLNAMHMLYNLFDLSSNMEHINRMSILLQLGTFAIYLWKAFIKKHIMTWYKIDEGENHPWKKTHAKHQILPYSHLHSFFSIAFEYVLSMEHLLMCLRNVTQIFFFEEGTRVSFPQKIWLNFAGKCKSLMIAYFSYCI